MSDNNFYSIFQHATYREIADWCGLKTDMAVCKWRKTGRLPRTDYTGETQYAENISDGLKRDKNVEISPDDIRKVA